MSDRADGPQARPHRAADDTGSFPDLPELDPTDRFCALLYPDPKQRIVLGWRIRWIAGLFSLLMLAAGMGPAYAATAPAESDPIGIEACRAAVSVDEHVSTALIDPAVGDLCGFKTAAEAEGEKAEEADASPTTASAWLYSSSAIAGGAYEIEDGSLRRIDVSGRVSPRAPPIA